jgi:hypothetical protein
MQVIKLEYFFKFGFPNNFCNFQISPPPQSKKKIPFIKQDKNVLLTKLQLLPISPKLINIVKTETNINNINKPFP